MKIFLVKDSPQLIDTNRMPEFLFNFIYSSTNFFLNMYVPS